MEIRASTIPLTGTSGWMAVVGRWLPCHVLDQGLVMCWTSDCFVMCWTRDCLVMCWTSDCLVMCWTSWLAALSCVGPVTAQNHLGDVVHSHPLLELSTFAALLKRTHANNNMHLHCCWHRYNRPPPVGTDPDFDCECSRPTHTSSYTPSPCGDFHAPSYFDQLHILLSRCDYLQFFFY